MTGKSGTGVSPVSFACDAARNMTRCWGSGFTNQYFYDHARRLIRVFSVFSGQTSSFTFVYDGLDIVAKVDNLTGDMIYFSRGLGIAPGVGDVLAETHILGSLTQTYIYVQNHRGDTIALVSNSTVVARYEYSAWGNVVSHTGADAWLTFSGKHYDSDAGLYYYGFRWYDPQAKRWTQPDPTGLAEGLDLYQFCGNDPVNGVDGDGLATVEIQLTNGNKREIPSNMRASELVRLIGTLDDKSIKRFFVQGHGSKWTINTSDDDLFPGDEAITQEVLSIGKNGFSFYQHDFGYKIRSLEDLVNQQACPSTENFTALLGSKLSDDAIIELRGCNTANGVCNISRLISIIYPNVTVIGQAVWTYGIGPGGDEAVDKAWDLWPKSYKNGKVINNALWTQPFGASGYILGYLYIFGY